MPTAPDGPPYDHLAADAARIVRLAVSRPARGAGPRVLAVDGRSGAGKTTLADRLAPALPGEHAQDPSAVEIVRLDDLYPGWDGLEAAVPMLVEGVLRPLSIGRSGTYPSWDWAAARSGPRRVVPPRDWLLVEGAGCGARACAPYLDLLIWLEAPEGARRERALARDGDLFRPHWERWAAQEAIHVARENTPARADLVLDAARWLGR